ncbi:MAG TPA: peptide chain release factor N(5)-glutamine methyltransferase [Allosphingosinicella sp.]|jgi:release factor glutamine methyltransferase|nr:peptide chain release factor N(5)-glutamine methyltransferase [Allosphingosinicella sp.]
MKAREALTKAAERLRMVGATPRFDAELLMAHALGTSREELILSRLDDEAPASFEAMVARRERSEPVAYIIGRRGFWTIDLEIGQGALIPRPDTETLIEAAVSHFAEKGPRTVLDLGTGPGTLLLAALDQWPQARGLGIDISEAALAYARRNAERLGLADRALFQCGDWAEGIEGPFDLILCNPPYVDEQATLMPDVVEWEPEEALFAAEQGLAEYRRLAEAIPQLLGDGLACVEIGLGQGEQVSAMFEAAGLRVSGRRDLAGHLRCLVLSH